MKPLAPHNCTANGESVKGPIRKGAEYASEPEDFPVDLNVRALLSSEQAGQHPRFSYTAEPLRLPASAGLTSVEV
eukprot:6412195-Amphidinium_carterae.1